MWFDKKGKLSSCHIGLFFILEVMGEVVYHLTLLPELTKIHPVFEVSMILKYVGDPSHVIDFGDLYVEEYISYVVRPIQILMRRSKS